MAGTFSRSKPSPGTGVVATAWKAGIWGAGASVEGREGAGAEARREGAGAETRREGAGASDREGAARRGAGSVRRGGRGAGRGAVTVISGSVSDTWLQDGPGEVSSPENVNAPKATAPNSRRSKT